MFDKINVGNRILVNTFFQFFSKFFSVFLSLLTVFLLTRHLGTEGYGSFALVFTYLSFFAVFSDMGFNQVIVREFSQGDVKSPSVKASLFNLKLLLNIISIFLPLVVLPLFPYSYSLKLAVVVGAFAVGVGNLASYGSSILQAQLRLDFVAALDLLIKFVTVFAIYCLTRIQAGLYPMIGAVLIGNFVGLCISYLLVKKKINFSFYLDFSLAKKIMRLGIPVGISSFLALLYFKVDTLMLSLMRSPVEVGIYSLSYKILENILMLWGLYMASVYPLWSRYFHNNKYSDYRHLLKSTYVALSVLSVVVIFMGYNFTPLIMDTLGGSSFSSSAGPFRILLWAVPLFFLNNIFYNVILSFGKTKYLIHPFLLCLTINVLLNIYSIPRYGYIGTSVTTVITELLISISYLVILFRNFKQEASYWKISI